jgi:RNA polymerase sigma factor (sigma-70 family)
MKSPFDDQFEELFREHFHRLYRYLARLSGDRELAGDLAQETFVRLYERGSSPDTPAAWLITVAMNLFRNARSKDARRQHLLRVITGEERVAAPPFSQAEAAETRAVRHRVRNAVDRLPERERSMLLLRAEGYSYREIAAALSIEEASIGTLLARAKQAFLALYEERSDAS